MLDVDLVLDVDTAIVEHDLQNATGFNVYLGKAVHDHVEVQVHDHVEVQVHVHGDVAVNRFEKRVSRQKLVRSSNPRAYGAPKCMKMLGIGIGIAVAIGIVFDARWAELSTPIPISTPMPIPIPTPTSSRI